MSKYFILEAKLSTPFIRMPDAWLTLDSLLAAAIYNATGSVERAHSEIPLERIAGVWCGSAAFPIEPRYSSAPFISALSPHFGDYDNDSRKSVLRAGGDDQPQLDRRLLMETGRVVWFGCGNPEACKALMETLDGVGKKIMHGYGSIESVRISPMEVDRSLVLPDGSPARPIPASVWACIAGDDIQAAEELPQDMTGYQPAYWDTRQFALCVVPAVSALSEQQLLGIEGGVVGTLQNEDASAETSCSYRSGVQFFAEHAGAKLAARAAGGNRTKLADSCNACGSREDLRRTGNGYTTLCGTCSTFGGGYEGIKRPGRIGAGWMGVVTPESTSMVTSVEASPKNTPFTGLKGVAMQTGKPALSVFLRDTLLNLPEPPFLLFVSGQSSVKVIQSLQVSWSPRRVHIGGSDSLIVNAVLFNELFLAWKESGVTGASLTKAVLTRDAARYAYDSKVCSAAKERLEKLVGGDAALLSLVERMPSTYSDDWAVLRSAISATEREK